MKYRFPAIFEQDLENPQYINVTIPDIIGAVTFGEGEEEAMNMAKDLLKSMLEFDYVKNTNPSTLEQTQKNFPDKKILMVEVE